MIRNELHTLIQEAIRKLGFSIETPFSLEHPADMAHGDYATNVAMALAKGAGRNPKELAEAIAQGIRDEKDERIGRVSVAGPGFINISLTSEFFFGEIARAFEEKHGYGRQNMFEGTRVLIEHSSPNLFKPFHIGHFMNNAIGESVKRLMEYSGAEVTTISYPSDVSLGIAKAVFMLMRKDAGALDDESMPLKDKVAFLGECYAEGTAWYDEHEEDHLAIRGIADELYRGDDTPAVRLYKKAREANLAYFTSITGRLGSSFDGYVFESEAGAEGKRLVEEHLGKVFSESHGAVVYKGEERGLHTRVFLNAQGNPTYEAKDLGLLSIKFSRFKPDASIFVTDYEQGPYFKVVADAAGQINADWKDKTVHITHGRLTFKGKKLSSRLGGVPLAEDLLDAVLEEVRERSPDEPAHVQDEIALGALKFAIVRSEAGKNANFDPETSLSFEGDSGPYLQYTHARLNSLIEKGKGAGFTIYQQSPHGEIHDIHRLIYRFPEAVQEAIERHAPHGITAYLLSLAHAFNSYYGKVKIIDEDDHAGTNERLLLVAAAKQILHSGLHLLGISAPERM